jgi:hypothetical protein
MKTIFFISCLILAAFAGSITEMQRPTLDFSSRARSVTFYVSLDNDVDGSGQLEITMPTDVVFD